MTSAAGRAVPDVALAVRRPEGEYVRLERRERREAVPEAGPAGQEAQPVRGR
jgi:hypothetical protein